MSSTPFRQRLALQVLAKPNRLNAAGAQGFTLIELLVVIVILGVLGAVGYQQYLAQIARANLNTALNTATAVAKNCAALRVTGDEGDFSTEDFLGDGSRFLGTPACTASGNENTFEIEIGTSGAANARSATATVTSDGAVTPAVEST